MITGALHRVVEIAIHLKLLPAIGTAIQPETDAGKAGGHHAGMIQRNPTPGAGDGGADGIVAGIDRRSIGEVQGYTITAVLPAVDQ